MPVHVGATRSAKCADAADELDLRRVRSELRTECWNVQLRHFRIELFFQVLDVVLVGLGPQEILQQIKLRRHLDREGT